MAYDIANVKAILADNRFHDDLSPHDTTTIQQRRRQLEQLLADLEGRLRRAATGSARFEEVPGEPPSCILNGNADGCFISAAHTISINGTGQGDQVTSVAGSQTATISYTLNGTLKTPIVLGSSGIGMGTVYSLHEAFTFDKPDCNFSAYRLESTGSHTLSVTIASSGNTSVDISGSRTSSNHDACAQTALTISLNKTTISSQNDYALFDVTGLLQCTLAGAVTANQNVATITSLGNNHFAVYPQGPGTTTITATCGTQYGYASITVADDPDPPPPDPCDDPMTPGVESCDDPNAQNNYPPISVTYTRDAYWGDAPEEWYTSPEYYVSYKIVCDVKDWYIWNASHTVQYYDGTEILGCWMEPYNGNDD